MEAIELKGLRVQFVSYVDNPANNKKFFIVKSEDKKEANVKKDVKILTRKDKKKDPHLIYGVVYSPGEVDLEGEFMTAKEIQKSAHQFLEDYRLVDKDHNNIPGAGVVKESYVALQDMNINGEEITKGSWILVTEPDDETWEEIEKGTYTGYSLYGFAKEKVKSEVKKSIWDKVKETFGIKKDNVNIKKDFAEELEDYRNTDFWYLFYIFEEAILKITWDNPQINGKELKNKIVKNLEQLISTVKEMTFEKVSKEFEVSKPYPNEHACRLNDPSNYKEFSRKEREHEGKKYSVIYGIKEDGNSEEQAYRYDKDVWSEEEARKHCDNHNGSFHASSEDEDTETSKFKAQGEEMDEELKKEIDELIDSKINEIQKDVNDMKEQFGNVNETVKNAIKEMQNDDDEEEEEEEPDDEKEASKNLSKLKEDLQEAKKSMESIQKSILQSQQAISDIDDDDETKNVSKEKVGLPNIL